VSTRPVFAWTKTKHDFDKIHIFRACDDLPRRFDAFLAQHNEANRPANETVFIRLTTTSRNGPGPASVRDLTKGILVMWTIVNLLYREYCRTRIVEMRRTDSASRRCHEAGTRSPSFWRFG
jgi:hypothetical protein